MPVKKIKKNGIYYRWGKTGKLYRSREKARKQGVAITLSKLRQAGRIPPRNSTIVKKHRRKGRKVRQHKRRLR